MMFGSRKKSNFPKACNQGNLKSAYICEVMTLVWIRHPFINSKQVLFEMNRIAGSMGGSKLARRMGVVLTCMIVAATQGGISQGVAPPPTFKHEIKPLLEKKCAECHGGGTTKGGLSLATLSDVIAGA